MAKDEAAHTHTLHCVRGGYTCVSSLVCHQAAYSLALPLLRCGAAVHTSTVSGPQPPSPRSCCHRRPDRHGRRCTPLQKGGGPGDTMYYCLIWSQCHLCVYLVCIPTAYIRACVCSTAAAAPGLSPPDNGGSRRNNNDAGVLPCYQQTHHVAATAQHWQISS